MTTDNVIPVAFSKPSISSVAGMSVVELERLDMVMLQELMALTEITGWIPRGVITYKAAREAVQQRGNQA